MEKFLKRIIVLCLMVSMSIALSGCFFSEKHCTKSKAQQIAEDLTGQKVTYVTMHEIPEDNEIVYVFADADGNEFAIISKLTQKNFDGMNYGKKRCSISDNYITAMVLAHKEEVQGILEEYNLLSYVSEIVDWDEDIRMGEGINSMRIYLDIPAGDAEQNLDVLRDIAAAGAAIDELLSLSYDMEYVDRAERKGIRYEEYNSYNGIQVTYEWQVIGYDGEYWDKCDITDFNYSTSDNDRFTEGELLEYLYEQLSTVDIAVLQ